MSLAGQEARFARALDVVRQGIADRAFPGAAVSILWRGTVIALQGFGRFTYDPEAPTVRPETIFDIASVTKAVATTSASMRLYERGMLDLEAPVASLAPEFAGEDARRRRVTLRMLLAHASGLPAYVKLFAGPAVETLLATSPQAARQAVVQAAMATPLGADPGTRAEYSDIGFIVLGEVLERLAGEPLDSFCRREIFGPLGMAETGFRTPEALRSRIPPTEDDRAWRRCVIQGEVQDENAWAMGGVAGHAGVFTTALDVARFAHCLLNGGATILRPETVELFTRREASPPGTSRALGWDTPSEPSQSGRYFGARSFGHLGYAGTSLWIDPDRQLAVTLLTNRTWPDRRSQQIKQVRPRFHDAVVEGLR